MLELFHPTWSGGTVAQAVFDVRGWWISLHLLLIIGYAALVWTIWPNGLIARVVLGLFLALNTAYITIDGPVVGVLASTDPTNADALWSSPAVSALANLTGAAWSAALLTTALERQRSVLAAAVAALTWMSFLLSGGLWVASLLSRVLALGLGAGFVYNAGGKGLPFALVTFAAVLRQHVGTEAALGMLCLSVAAALRERSSPAVASQP